MPPAMIWAITFAGVVILVLIFCHLRRKFKAFLAKMEAEVAEREARWKAEQAARRGPDFKMGGGKPEPRILLYQPPDDYLSVPIDPDKPMSVVDAALEKRDRLRLKYLAMGASRFGGVPDLPADLPWPEFEGKKLPFLAQLDLAELPKSLLPADGWLLVFGWADSPHDKTPVCVLHHRGPREELKRAVTPREKEIWTDC